MFHLYDIEIEKIFTEELILNVFPDEVEITQSYYDKNIKIVKTQNKNFYFECDSENRIIRTWQSCTY